MKKNGGGREEVWFKEELIIVAEIVNANVKQSRLS